MKHTVINTFALTITAVLFIYICCIGIKNIFRYNVFVFEYDKLIAQRENLLAQNQLFKTRLNNLNNNAFWELLIRQKLGYVKEDEVVYKIIRIKEN